VTWKVTTTTVTNLERVLNTAQADGWDLYELQFLPANPTADFCVVFVRYDEAPKDAL
jgi:hypothetical protein